VFGGIPRGYIIFQSHVLLAGLVDEVQGRVLRGVSAGQHARHFIAVVLAQHLLDLAYHIELWRDKLCLNKDIRREELTCLAAIRRHIVLRLILRSHKQLFYLVLSECDVGAFRRWREVFVELSVVDGLRDVCVHAGVEQRLGGL